MRMRIKHQQRARLCPHQNRHHLQLLWLGGGSVQPLGDEPDRVPGLDDPQLGAVVVYMRPLRHAADGWRGDGGPRRVPDVRGGGCREVRVLGEPLAWKFIVMSHLSLVEAMDSMTESIIDSMHDTDSLASMKRSKLRRISRSVRRPSASREVGDGVADGALVVGDDVVDDVL